MGLLNELIISVILLAFVLECFDATLGMGYGTAMTPILLLMDYNLLDIVPAILISNVVIGLAGGFFHHQFRNIRFTSKHRDIKVAAALSIFGIAGVVGAVYIVFNIPESFLIGYIGVLIIVTGIITLFRIRKKAGDFSWFRLILMGLLGSFNKGISGGGYGPVMVGGQIMAGMKSKNAVGISTFSEGVISAAGACTYLFVQNTAINWNLMLSLAIGGTIAVPLAAYFVSKITLPRLKLMIGLGSIAVGIITLLNLFR